jgi:hypothetical protein
MINDRESKIRSLILRIGDVIEELDGIKNLLGVKEKIEPQTDLIEARDSLGIAVNAAKTNDEFSKQITNAIEAIAHANSTISWVVRSFGFGFDMKSSLEKELIEILKELYKIRYKE